MNVVRTNNKHIHKNRVVHYSVSGMIWFWSFVSLNILLSLALVGALQQGKRKWGPSIAKFPASSSLRKYRRTPHYWGKSSHTELGKLFRGLIPLLILSTSEIASASPLNPQAISLRGPFFQGWLVRTIDHSQGISIMFIVGSFSGKGSRAYDQHYIFCGISSPQGNYDSHLLPDPSTVIVSGGDVSSMLPFRKEKLLNITWSAQGVGSFSFQVGSRSYRNMTT